MHTVQHFTYHWQMIHGHIVYTYHHWTTLVANRSVSPATHQIIEHTRFNLDYLKKLLYGHRGIQ